MNLSRFAAALAFTAASFSAQAGIYHYTGNQYVFDTINPSPQLTRATLDIDVADDYTGKVHLLFNNKATLLTMSAGAFSVSQGNHGLFLYDIDLVGGNITNWFITLFASPYSFALISANHPISPDPQGIDSVDRYDALAGTYSPAAYASVNPGAWQRAQASAVPEPGTLPLLLAGLALAALAARMQGSAARQA